MRLPDGNGIELVAHIQKHHPQLPVAVITAYGNAQAAVESLKAGAFDFVSKPVDLTMLRKLVDDRAAVAVRAGHQQRPPPTSCSANRRQICRAARPDRASRAQQAPVHIAGESGTGKELVARLIHAQGPRAGSPFVPVNCGAIPGELMESEFFGHLKGSFTGALRDKTGLFQAAEGGTLFLDEVADLPLHMQVKLLRAVQERAVRPVGAEAEIAVNVRMISATHKDLNALVQQGAFRQDLYYRLNVIEVRAAPLREHAQDIPLLVKALIGRLGIDSIDAEALKQLMAYSFPGNVRELENILERAAALCENSRIRSSDLQLRALAPAKSAAGGALEERVEEMEKLAIREALEKSRHNKTRAAQLLGMSFRQLRYRIKKLQIE